MDDEMPAPELVARAEVFFENTGKDPRKPWNYAIEMAAMYEAGSDDSLRIFLANKHFVDHHPNDGSGLFSFELVEEALGHELMDWYGFIGVAQAYCAVEEKEIREDQLRDLAANLMKFSIGAVLTNTMAITGECPLWRTHSMPTKEE